MIGALGLQVMSAALDTLAAAGLPATALKLEITESALMREPDGLARIVSEVCTAGVGLHLDDFGTGYSSLAALQQLPVDALKIDRSFVAALTDGSDVIVRSTIALAHSLGMQVIAEGIENPVQLRRLRALGCEYGPGYLFSRPLPPGAIRELLAGWAVRPSRRSESAPPSSADRRARPKVWAAPILLLAIAVAGLAQLALRVPHRGLGPA